MPKAPAPVYIVRPREPWWPVLLWAAIVLGMLAAFQWAIFRPLMTLVALLLIVWGAENNRRR